jgi:RecA/RadA recombinase
MQRELDMIPLKQSTSSDLLAPTTQSTTGSKKPTAHQLMQPNFIKTLDPLIDELLAGGFPCGYVTEVVGER